MSQFRFINKIIPLLLLICQNAFASVNILSWVGYFDETIINKLQKQCKTTVSLDQYYSSSEFLRRFQKQEYSIAIFPASVYNLVSDKIVNYGISFNDIKENYHQNILSSFDTQDFTNAAIFALSITGFLYNPKQIEIDKNDEIKTIFSKAKNKKITILDAPSIKLISSKKNFSNLTDSVKEFKQLLNGTNYFIINDTFKIVKEKDFAFSFIWVGSAYKRIREHPHLKFIVLPRLSYITADLIAAMDKTTETSCVAKQLAGKEVLEPILSRAFYFSPYGIPEKIENSAFAKEYNNYINNIGKLMWHESLNKEDYQIRVNLWQRIKIEMKNN